MIAGGQGTLDAKGATQLAILGVVSRAPALGTEIVSLVKHIVGRAWQPTSDVIAVNLDELRRHGLIRTEGAGRGWDTTRYAIAESGETLLHELLLRPMAGSAGQLDPNAVALKVCFLDLLSAEEQAGQLDGIGAGYAREIAHLREAIRRCACDWPYVPGWMELELRRLEAERDWFADVRRGLTAPRPAAVQA
ncbi:MAG: hypothetical protein ACK4QW_06220 [Alphaproteobacteria bacterium]